MTKVSLFLTVSLSALALVGCSAVKNMDEMKDTTKDMKNTTEGMATTTNGMAKTTENMERTSDALRLTSNDLYEDMRQGNAMTFRSQRLEAMEKNSDQLAKLSEAAKYFMSYEFQLYKSHEKDSAEKLDLLKKSAVEEFFREVSKYATDLNDVSMIRLTSRDARANLNALAATMHMINPNQLINAKELGFEPISMMDLLEEALPYAKQVDSGEKSVSELPGYVKDVLDFEGVAYYLLQVRHNFLAMMATAKISRLTEKNQAQQLVSIGRMSLKPWDANLLAFNTVELESVVTWLSEATRNVNLLKSLDQTPKYDQRLRTILQNAVYPENQGILPVSGRESKAVAVDLAIKEYLK